MLVLSVWLSSVTNNKAVVEPSGTLGELASPDIPGQLEPIAWASVPGHSAPSKLLPCKISWDILMQYIP